MGEGPVDEALGDGFEAGIVEEIGEGQESVEVVGTALPGLACAAKPAAVWADVRPGLTEVAAEAIGLDEELSAEPSGGTDGAEGQEGKCAWGERGAILDGRCLG